MIFRAFERKISRLFQPDFSTEQCKLAAELCLTSDMYFCKVAVKLSNTVESTFVLNCSLTVYKVCAVRAEGVQYRLIDAP